MLRKGLSMTNKVQREKASAGLMLSQALSAENMGSNKVTAPSRHARFKGTITRAGVALPTNMPDSLTGSTLKPLAAFVAGKGGTKKLALGTAEGASGPVSGTILFFLTRMSEDFLEISRRRVPFVY